MKIKMGFLRNLLLYVVIVAIYALTVSTLMYHAQHETTNGYKEFVTSTTTTLSYDLVNTVYDNEANTCAFKDTTLFNETVKIVYPDFNEDDEVLGRWDENTNTISLMQPGGLTIRTVSHEVSHMVDSFMKKYNPPDPHFEAYMQGAWTECVSLILEHDLDCATNSRCNI